MVAGWAVRWAVRGCETTSCGCAVEVEMGTRGCFGFCCADALADLGCVVDVLVVAVVADLSFFSPVGGGAGAPEEEDAAVGCAFASFPFSFDPPNRLFAPAEGGPNSPLDFIPPSLSRSLSILFIVFACCTDGAGGGAIGLFGG